MDFGDDDYGGHNHDLIHLHKFQAKGRKHRTRVTGIPQIYDYDKILKFWRKNFQCSGHIQQEGKQGKDKKKDRDNKDKDDELKKQEIILNGDHRQQIKRFLIHMGISMEENIRIHGAM